MIKPIPENYKPLISDLDMLQRREGNRLKLAERIKNLEASNDEIIDWHYGSDGLRETIVVRMLLGEINPQYRDMAKEGIVDLIHEGEISAIGGSLLVLRTAYPNYFEGLDSEQAHSVFKDIANQSKLDLKKDTKGSVMGYVTSMLLRLNRIDVDPDNDEIVKNLLIGADMLRTARTETATFQQMYEELADEQKIPRKDRSIFYGHCNSASAIIYDFIAGLPHFNSISNKNTMLYSVKACQQMVAAMLRDVQVLEKVLVNLRKNNKTSSFGEIESTLSNLLVTQLLTNLADGDTILTDNVLEEFKHTAVVYLADSIKRAYIGENNDGLLYESDYSKKQIRGMLFEAIWQLDFIVLNIINNKFNPFYTPSLTFEDQPKIGYPALNHGFDGTIRTHNGLNLIQLKSSKYGAEQGHYHPNIRIVYDEKDTDEAEPRRLTAKLGKYIEIFNKTTITPEEAKTAERFVLSSVKKEFYDGARNAEEKKGESALSRAAINYTGLRFEDIADSRVIEKPFSGLNRKQRRDQARKNKKKR
ncbi:hypothetical protein H6795_04310 [Candidatus Nomurabacteria bacterium]|nr:hypothetical protein [Candidatus Nomurabacteria bacterium]